MGIHITYSLSPSDCKSRTLYCRCFQESVVNGFLDPELAFYSDEHDSFYAVTERVKITYWSKEYPCAAH
jgi:hypothetical protein